MVSILLVFKIISFNILCIIFITKNIENNKVNEMNVTNTNNIKPIIIIDKPLNITSMDVVRVLIKINAKSL